MVLKVEWLWPSNPFKAHIQLELTNTVLASLGSVKYLLLEVDPGFRTGILESAIQISVCELYVIASLTAMSSSKSFTVSITSSTLQGFVLSHITVTFSVN